MGSGHLFWAASGGGRPATLAWLRREAVAALPAARRQALSAERAWEWDDLATPRNLLAALATEARVKIEGLDQIPHDLVAGPAAAAPGLDRPVDVGGAPSLG